MSAIQTATKKNLYRRIYNLSESEALQLTNYLDELSGFELNANLPAETLLAIDDAESGRTEDISLSELKAQLDAIN